MPTTSKTETVCLFGPTASGKTAVLSEVRDFFPNLEIISADSVQVYRGLDIGSAKPSKEELTRTPHHIIDILPPSSQFSAGEFVQRADLAVEEIRTRGGLPVISGGTAFYFANYLFGLPSAPPSSPEVRERVEFFVKEEGEEALHRLLAEADPESHRRLAPRDLYRRKRALEVFWTSGRPLSSFELSRELRSGLRVRLLALDRTREELYRRINARVDQMFAAGFLDEAEALLAAGWDPGCPALRSIGYLQLVQWISGGKKEELEEVKETVRRETRRYAKRQLTFFRSLPGVEWVTPDEASRILAEALTGSQE